MLALLLGLAGCATGHVILAADGQPAIEVRCRREQWRCANKAERICRGGYFVLDNGVHPETVVRPSGAVATMQPVFHDYIVVRCR
jgi:hypothetical protein